MVGGQNAFLAKPPLYVEIQQKDRTGLFCGNKEVSATKKEAGGF